MGLRELSDTFGKVFGNWKYSLLAISTAGIFYLFNAIVSNFYNFIYFFRENDFFPSMSFLFTLIKGFHKTIIPVSVFTIILIGLLSGVLISLLFYRYKALNGVEKIGLFAGISLFFGAFIPGCVSCGVGLISLFGLGSALASLPFKGNEVSWLAVFLLIFSIIKTSNNFLTCERKVKMKGGIKNE